jgi:hypothetical protein
MTYAPPAGDSIELEGLSGFVPVSGDQVLLQPASDPRFLSIPIAQSWQQSAPRFVEMPFTQQWSIPTVCFNNLPIHHVWRATGPRFRSWPLDLQTAQWAPDFGETRQAQSWSLQPFTYVDRSFNQRWQQKNLVIGECRFHAQWLLEATAVWTPVISATVYRFALENSQGRAEMPISNFSGQLRSGEPSYLQVTIPDARAWADVIADFALQTDTDIVIQAGYRWSDGRLETQDIARTRLRNVRYDIGARSSSVQLDGIDTRVNSAPKAVSLQGANYRSQDEAGRVRYRCAMNFEIRPGDTALINGEQFIVGELSYSVTVDNAMLEVAEALI